MTVYVWRHVSPLSATFPPLCERIHVNRMCNREVCDVWDFMQFLTCGQLFSFRFPHLTVGAENIQFMCRWTTASQKSLHLGIEAMDCLPARIMRFPHCKTSLMFHFIVALLLTTQNPFRITHTAWVSLVSKSTTCDFLTRGWAIWCRVVRFCVKV